MTDINFPAVPAASFKNEKLESLVAQYRSAVRASVAIREKLAAGFVEGRLFTSFIIDEMIETDAHINALGHVMNIISNGLEAGKTEDEIIDNVKRISLRGSRMGHRVNSTSNSDVEIELAKIRAWNSVNMFIEGETW